MSAWVSPPQLKTSHIVEVAASIAHAASTALPSCMKILAPAVAANGLPVTATQCCPCNGGLVVFAIARVAPRSSTPTTIERARCICMVEPRLVLDGVSIAYEFLGPEGLSQRRGA